MDGNTTNYAPSGNVLNGTGYNINSVIGHTGLSGTAYSLNGSTSSYIMLPANPGIKSDSVFFSGWFYIDSLPNEQYLVYTKNNCNVNFEAYSLITYNSPWAGQQVFRVSKSGAFCQYAPQVDSQISPAIGNWYHVCFYVDNSIMKLYVNGVLQGTSSHNIQFSYQTGKDVFLGVTNESNFNLPFKGRIDDVRFYNRELSAQEVMTLYTQSPACTVSDGTQPAAFFQTSGNQVCVGSTVTFTDLSTNNPTSWSWQMPGASPANSSTNIPSVTYSSPGVYTVSLVATNGQGTSTNTAIQTITVSNCASAAFLPSADRVCVGSTVTFSDQSSNNPTVWNWQMPGGSPPNSSLSNPSVVYNTPGIYTVSLTVSNGQGNNSNAAVHTITVGTCVSSAFQSSGDHVCAGGTLTFTDQSTNGPTGWNWQMPGGSPASSTLSNPSVVYTAPGVYTISLNAYSSQGNGTNTAMQTVTVYPCISAGFQPSENQICAGGTITFYDQSTNNPTAWSWDISGGAPSLSSQSNPSAVYFTPGVYTVSLISFNSQGSSTNTAVQTITVNNCVSLEEQTPVSQISIYPNPGNGSFFVSNLPNHQIFVYDLLGRSVECRQTKSEAGAKGYTLPNAPAGVYFVRILDDKGRLLHTNKVSVVE